VSFRQAVSQNGLGPDDDLQALNVNAKTMAMAGIISILIISDFDAVTKITIGKLCSKLIYNLTLSPVGECPFII
jgi:hypothetical protein